MVRAIAIQAKWSSSDYRTYGDFQTKTRSLMSLARARMAKNDRNLVVLPEDYGTPLILAASKVDLEGSKSLESAIRKAVVQRLPVLLWRRLTSGASFVNGLFLEYAREMAREYLGLMTQLAKMHKAFLVPGSILLPEMDFGASLDPVGSSVYNTAFLISPEGHVLGWQRKLHLIDIEGQAGLDVTPGKFDWIKTFHSEIGKLGVAICLDGFKDEVVGELVRQGAEILIQPSANPEGWNDSLRREWEKGCLEMVQRFDPLRFGINPMMVGEMFGLVFEGMSSIVAKAETTSDRSGYLARAKTVDREEIIWADLAPY